MINNLLTLRRLILIIPLLLLTILAGAIQANSQETEPPSTVVTAGNSPQIQVADDEITVCTERLDKTLDALEKSQTVISNKSAELETCARLRSKEEIYNGELLKAVALLTSSEKRDKSFFRKLTEQLYKVLKAATDPAHLSTITTLIILTRKLSK